MTIRTTARSAPRSTKPHLTRRGPQGRRVRTSICILLGITAVALAACTPPPPQPHQWRFITNMGAPSNSRLHWASGWDSLQSWRAGSGDGVTTDECVKDHGPLPVGTYNIIQAHSNWPGSVVKGPVLYIGDKYCHDGSYQRTELFVHSSYEWTEARYRSDGCIKVASTGTPSTAGGHIREVYDRHHQPYVPTQLVVW